MGGLVYSGQFHSSITARLAASPAQASLLRENIFEPPKLGPSLYVSYHRCAGIIGRSSLNWGQYSHQGAHKSNLSRASFQ